MSSSGRRPSPMSTIVPTSIRTMRWRNRSASMWRLTPRPSGRLSHSARGSPAAIMRLVGLGREGAEIVLAPDHRGRGAEQLEVERPTQGPLELAAETVRPRPHRVRCRSDNVGRGRTCGRESRAASGEPTEPSSPWQQRVERASQGGVGPAGWGAEADALADRMDPGIGSAGRMGHGPASKETLQNPLEFDLNRASGGLALPPDKAGAVVLECGEEGPAHRPGI